MKRTLQYGIERDLEIKSFPAIRFVVQCTFCIMGQQLIFGSKFNSFLDVLKKFVILIFFLIIKGRPEAKRSNLGQALTLIVIGRTRVCCKMLR